MRNITHAQRDLLRYLTALQAEYGHVVRMRYFFRDQFLLFHPAAIRHVLQSNQYNYAYGHRSFKLYLGSGLLSSEGEHWSRHRSIIQTAFHRDRLTEYTQVTARSTDRLLRRWRQRNALDGSVNVAQHMVQLARQISSEILLGTDIIRESDQLNGALDVMIGALGGRLHRPVATFLATNSVILPSVRRALQARVLLRTVLLEQLATRRRGRNRKFDILQLLVDSLDDADGMESNDEVLDELVTLLIAGSDTIANALSWTLYLLSLRPDASAKIAEEASNLNADISSATPIDGLRYTQAVVQESMRLYPPAVGFGRRSIRDDTVWNFHIPAGSSVWICPYITHRLGEFWEDSDAFEPGRFDRTKAASRVAYSYLPFGGGRRVCVGSGLAMVQLKLIIAMICQRYVMELDASHPVWPASSGSLRPGDGIWIVMRPRG